MFLCVVALSANASLVRSCSGVIPKARINSLTVSEANEVRGNRIKERPIEKRNPRHSWSNV